MIESLSFVVGGINLLFPILITILQKLKDTIDTTEDVLRNEHEDAYREVGKMVFQGSLVDDDLQRSLNRVRRLHCASSVDFVALRVVGAIWKRVIGVSLLVLLAAAASILVGHLLFEGARNLLVYYIPIGSLAINLFLLFIIFRIDSFLSDTRRRYRNGDYRG